MILKKDGEEYVSFPIKKIVFIPDGGSCHTTRLITLDPFESPAEWFRTSLAHYEARRPNNPKFKF